MEQNVFLLLLYCRDYLELHTAVLSIQLMVVKCKEINNNLLDAYEFLRETFIQYKPKLC